MSITRNEIQEKIDEAKSSDQKIQSFISTWLDTTDETEENKKKILSDLNSYDLA